MPTQTRTTRNAKATEQDSAAAFDAFKFAVPGSVELPAAMREFAEKSIEQAKDAYARMKTAADDATDLIEDTYGNAREGAFAIGVKALDAAKANTDASFALARDLFGARTFADIVEIQTAFARRQFDALGAQAKELQDVAHKYVADTVKPAAAQFDKTVKDTKAA